MTDTKTCPFCAEEIAAAAIKCKHCGSMIDGAGSAWAPLYDYPPPMITGPIIVSAVWNLLVGAGWALSGISFLPCIGLIIAVPYFVLGYYEITTYQQGATMSPQELYDRCGVLSICQIVLGLTNVLPVVCGVLLLVYRDRLLAYEESPPA